GTLKPRVWKLPNQCQLGAPERGARMYKTPRSGAILAPYRARLQKINTLAMLSSPFGARIALDSLRVAEFSTAKIPPQRIFEVMPHLPPKTNSANGLRGRRAVSRLRIASGRLL